MVSAARSFLIRAAAVAALLGTCLIPGAPGALAQTMATSARSAILLEAGTGTILLTKDADSPLPPASMSKLMTVEVLFHAIREGRLSLDDRFPVSREASRMGGSKMFIREGANVRIEDLLRGIIILSGNDACIAVAEGMSGTEEGFAELLNHRAREIGLTGSTFANSSGWPHPDHRMTTRDIAALSLHIIREYPDLYAMFRETEFTWEDVKQSNRNPLLYLDVGADGLKTGHTTESGYSLAASAVRGERRLVLVVAGVDSVRNRSAEAQRLISWGFREFASGVVFEAGESLAEAEVWMGDDARIDLVLEEPMRATLPVSRSDTRAVLQFQEPIPAPIAKGQQVGTLTLVALGDERRTVPLVAARDVAAGGFLVRAATLIRSLLVSGQPE